jgi:hypothetical protein
VLERSIPLADRAGGHASSALAVRVALRVSVAMLTEEFAWDFWIG